MAEPDLLGRAYEYLIEQFADDAGKKGGEFIHAPDGGQVDRRTAGPHRADAHLRPRPLDPGAC